MNTTEKLRQKFEDIALKYADITEKRLASVLCDPESESSAMTEINEGIRMLAHITATLERVSHLEESDRKAAL